MLKILIIDLVEPLYIIHHNFKIGIIAYFTYLIPWHTAHTYENTHDVCEHCSTLCKMVLPQHAPIKKKLIQANHLP